MKNKYISAILILSLTITVLVSGCGKKVKNADKREEANTEEQVVFVEVEKAEKTSIESETVLNGKVKPAKEIAIVPKVPGKVTKVNYDVGDTVNKDDILFVIDDSDIKIQLNQSKSALNNAKTQYNDALTAYERAKKLYDIGGVSQQNYEQAESALKIAKEVLNQAQSAYELTQSKLEDTVVKSPIDGILYQKNIEVGEMASNASPAVSIVDLSYVTVDINVPENIINKVKLNSVVNVKINSASNEIIEGKIVNISPSADPRTQTYPVKIRISNDNQDLKGGMFAEITLHPERIEDVIVVPLNAVVNKDGQDLIYTVVDNKAVKNEVSTGISNSEYIEIKEGINEGDQIIVKGQNYVEDGTKVSIIDKE